MEVKGRGGGGRNEGPVSSLRACIATFKDRTLQGNGEGGEGAAKLDQCLYLVEETMRVRSEDVSLLQKALELCERERDEAAGCAEGLRTEVERLTHELEELKRRKEGRGEEREERVLQEEGDGEEDGDRVEECGGGSVKEEEHMERNKEEEKGPKEEGEREGEGWKEEEEGEREGEGWKEEEEGEREGEGWKEEEEGGSEREGRKVEEEGMVVERVDSGTPNAATSLEDQDHVTSEDKNAQSPIQSRSEEDAFERDRGVELASDGTGKLGPTQSSSVATITGLG